MTWVLPPIERLKAMSHDDYTALWSKAMREGFKPEGRFSEGDEVRVTFDSSQAFLGKEGAIERVDPSDDAYKFYVHLNDEDKSHWVTAVEPLHPDITVPELNTMEEADRFLDSITKER